MGLFGGSKFSEEELHDIWDERYRFFKVGRHRRIAIDRIKEFEHESGNKVRVVLDDGEELLLGVELEVFEAVVNLSPVSMNNLS